MTAKAPGKNHREGISLIELGEMFPDEAVATEWFEALIWPTGRHCPRCGSTETTEASATSGLPYWCPACRRSFSVRIGTTLERSRVPLRKWAWAIYLYVTSLKGVSSMKLHRDLKVTQKTAWFMLHRLREAWGESDGLPPFSGPVEADETYVGGKRKNKSNAERKASTGRGAVDMEAVVGVKDRAANKVAARPIPSTSAPYTAGFVAERAALGATVYTDEAPVYNALDPWFDREAVNHKAHEYVRGAAHTKRHGVLLVDAQARLPRHLPQDEPEASGSLRRGVRRSPQRPRSGHRRSDGPARRGRRRQAADVPRPDRRQRARVGGTRRELIAE